MDIDIIDFGISNYEEILKMQQDKFHLLINSKKRGEEERECLLIGEHYPVITLGRRANENNILVSEATLRDKNIKFFHIGRGGDVTYHCPGQLIVYPIIDLEKHRLGVKDYVSLLEECVIRLLARYDILGERVEGATGVWLDKGLPGERKICAIGIKCSHFCSMHGLSLNVNADLEGFNLINPCGFTDKGVTSMKKELKRDVDIEDVKKDFIDIFMHFLPPHIPSPRSF